MPEAATLFKEWSGYLKPEDLARIETAYDFSKNAHNGRSEEHTSELQSH